MIVPIVSALEQGGNEALVSNHFKLASASLLPYMSTMGMNIKNQEAHDLALEISQRTGETITATVLRALRALAEKERAKLRTPEEKLAAWEAYKASHPAPTGMMSNEEANEFLYDEHGLPK